MSTNYSIIIPHHNIPELLDRCLYSIPKRDDVQIIVVDDCSDIKYNQSIKNIEFKYPHVQFVYNDVAGGGGKARNIGLLYAKGKYILFADADDYFTPGFEKLLNNNIDNKADIIYFNAISLDSDKYTPAQRASHLNKAIKQYYNQKKEAEIFLRYKFGEPWCKMVKSTIIFSNKIKFDETPINNDTKYSYLVGFYAKNIEIIDTACYCVTDRPNSVSKLLNKERSIARVNIFSDADLFFKKHNIPVTTNWHFWELSRQFIYNKNIYQIELSILLKKGYSKKKIVFKMLSNFLQYILLYPFIKLSHYKIKL